MAFRPAPPMRLSPVSVLDLPLSGSTVNHVTPAPAYTDATPSGITDIVPSRFSVYFLPFSAKMYSPFGLNVIVPNEIRAPAPAWKSRGFVYQPAQASEPIGEERAETDPRRMAEAEGGGAEGRVRTGGLAGTIVRA